MTVPPKCIIERIPPRLRGIPGTQAVVSQKPNSADEWKSDCHRYESPISVTSHGATNGNGGTHNQDSTGAYHRQGGKTHLALQKCSRVALLPH